MATNRNTIIGINTIVLISIVAMYIMDSKINPGYVYKSIFKLGVFMVLPVIYTLNDKNIKIIDLIGLNQKNSCFIPYY